MSSDYAIARAAWLQLEQFATMAPAADKACRSCGRGTTAALCVTCENRRLDLFRRFGGRTVSTKRGSRRQFTAQREEWTPYPQDREDRQ